MGIVSFLDIINKPLVPSIPSYIKDSSHPIPLLENTPIPSNAMVYLRPLLTVAPAMTSYLQTLDPIARVRYQEKLTLLGLSVSGDPYELWSKEAFVENDVFVSSC